MINVLVTGANGFIGKHLVEALLRRKDVNLRTYVRGDNLDSVLPNVDVIYHLAGVNRPENEDDHRKINYGLTKEIIDKLVSLNAHPTFVLASSSQSDLSNAYGKSKRLAEELVEKWPNQTGGTSIIYKLKNVFGKWCRPNYNSVVATFCHNIANDLTIQISDCDKSLHLVYIDDVVRSFINILDEEDIGKMYRTIYPEYYITLGNLADIIQSFYESRKTLKMPCMRNRFDQELYATYMSYVNHSKLNYDLDTKIDNRGCLAEFIKSDSFGQIFVSRTNPGITRGNHYHHTKIEKFFVLEGDAIVRLRSIKPGDVKDVKQFSVSGKKWEIVEIPPGHTHSIENVGNTDMVAVFWASEVFNSEKPDTIFENVI